DAIGEAYDKTAKWLGLNLKRSGGPAIDELAKEENAKSLSFLVPMKQHKDCNFSYAGLKTQVMPRSLFLLQVRKIDWLGMILLLLFSELQCYILRKGVNVQSSGH
ncbi:hypothetical protein HN51_044898, partial [Arachis hypogaea]